MADPSKNEMPDFSNVRSGGSTTAKSVEPAFKTYEIKSGDTLSKIAKNEYGNANDWRRVYEANKDTIEDPDKIYPGQVIKLPL